MTSEIDEGALGPWYADTLNAMNTSGRWLSPSPVVDAEPEVASEAEIFGKRARQLRLAAGWTQEQLAEAAGITTTYTSDLERGTKVPRT